MATETRSVTSGAPVADGLRRETDLRIAERVHRSLIPATARRGKLAVACEFEPMIGVGGDYASVHFQDDQHVVVGICDVAGHGIGAALLATRVNSFVLNRAPEVRHPCELVDALNTFVFTHFADVGLHLTFFSLFLDLEKQTVVGAGCGHPPVLLYSELAGTVHRLESDNPPIGLFEDLSQSCAMSQIPFRPGDRLVLYTDGVTESRNPASEELGVEGVARLLLDVAPVSATEWAARMSEGLAAFRRGAPTTDDRLLLTITHLEEPAS